jgi:hypothetical protein
VNRWTKILSWLLTSGRLGQTKRKDKLITAVTQSKGLTNLGLADLDLPSNTEKSKEES